MVKSLKAMIAVCIAILSCGMCFAQSKGTIAPDSIPGAAVYIPYPVNIKLDGNLADWKGVPVQRADKGYPASPEKNQNQYVDFSVCADDTNIYIYMESEDAKIISGQHGADYWNEDSMEVYFNFTENLKRTSYAKGVMQITVSPVNIGKSGANVILSGVASNTSNAKVVAFKTSKGWALEMAVPYSSYFKASHGKTIGFQVTANGATEKDRNSKLSWSNYDTSDSSYKDPTVFGRGVFFKVGSNDIPAPKDMGMSIKDTFKASGAVGKAGKKIAWQDEFDYKGEPDQTKWAYDAPDAGKYNNELQTYTQSRDNSFVKDGILTIHASKDKAGKWTSARLFTSQKASWTYGYIEIKAKLPAGKGTWPAIWMMPQRDTYGAWPASGEIDIMEFVGFSPDVIHTSIHTNAYNHRKATQKTRSSTVKGVCDDYHTYAIEWNEKGIFWYVDDEPYFYFLNDGAGTSATWPFNKPFFLILNVAMGGDWGGSMGMDKNLKSADMNIDYVRVYK